ncbi:MAG: hypothetical protein ACHP84_11145 [Caulobacterales bacterium]
MNQDRFEALIAAFGADPRRWPAGERAAARAFEEAHPQIAARVAATERTLDALLDRYGDHDPSPVLRQRIIESAPVARAAARAWRWLAGAGIGVGLAAACAAGVMVGMTLAPASVAQAVAPASVETADESGAWFGGAEEARGG